ncbi:hypothetical protein Mapa_013474 [Marchantia paleacea]|nr:hypothetical protein Mapa_013474 [Marchantia paleacea]
MFYRCRNGWTGICLGEDGSNIPSRPELVDRLRDLGITRVRLYHTYNDTLRAFADSGIQLTVGITNAEFPTALSTVSSARDWVDGNILPFSSSNIMAIIVGNEVLSTAGEVATAMLLPAMKNLHQALNETRLDHIKVTTAHAFDVVTTSYPPSSGQFSDPARMLPIVRWLSSVKSNFVCNIYPYSIYRAGGLVTLDYSLLLSFNDSLNDRGSNLTYRNLITQNLDAVYAALEKVGFVNMRVTIGEIGWPSAGDGIDATVINARTHNQNLVAIARGATPTKPAWEIEAYISSMFNENQKPRGFQQHLGLYDPSDFQPVYVLDFGNIVTQNNRITRGMMLSANQSVVSNNGLYTFIMQSDCNLVLYHGQAPVWDSRTAGRATDGYLIMQDDGNAVVYGGGTALWASGTWGFNDGDHYIEVQDDGNTVMYNDERKALWATNTVAR